MSVMPSVSRHPTPDGVVDVEDWEELLVGVGEGSGLFRVVPGSVLLVTEPVVIGSEKVTIQCGEDGASDGNCVVVGGDTQFVTSGSSSHVELRGLTMVGSTGMSVVVTGYGSAAFSDCLWAVSALG